MPRPFSIFNFNLFSNAGFWALLLIFGIETLRLPPLENRYHSHEVDELVHSLRKKSFHAPVLFLGDSVAENVFHAFNGQPNAFDVFASNQAIEATGQYFLLSRYLEKNPAPEVIAYMAGLPFYGDLDQIYTENFVQRVFLNWREIAWMSAHKLDPSFTLKSLAYKFFPSFRFRLHLQQKIWGSAQGDVYTGFTSLQTPRPSPNPYSLSVQLAKFWRKLRGKTASERSWQRIMALTEANRILFHFYPAPTTESESGRQQTRDTLQAVHMASDAWPQVRIQDHFARTYPDDHFRDGSHFNAKGRAAIQPYQKQMADHLLRAAAKQTLNEKPLYLETMYSLHLRQAFGLPLPFELQGVHNLEGNRLESFRWTRPEFRIRILPAAVLQTLRLTTAPASPASEITVGGIPGKTNQRFRMKAGKQTVTLHLPATDNPLTVLFQTRVWHPDNMDPRELGIAIESIEIIPATTGQP